MTFGETVDIIQARRRLELESARVQALCAYRTAELVTSGVGIILGSKKAFPTIHEMFPAFFDPPKVQKQPWQITKERVEAYARAKQKRGDSP